MFIYKIRINSSSSLMEYGIVFRGILREKFQKKNLLCFLERN